MTVFSSQVLNTQRDKVYGQRRRALLSRDLSPQMTEFAERTVDDVLEVSRRQGSSVELKPDLFRIATGKPRILFQSQYGRPSVPIDDVWFASLGMTSIISFTMLKRCNRRSVLVDEDLQQKKFCSRSRSCGLGWFVSKESCFDRVRIERRCAVFWA